MHLKVSNRCPIAVILYYGYKWFNMQLLLSLFTWAAGLRSTLLLLTAV